MTDFSAEGTYLGAFPPLLSCGKMCRKSTSGAAVWCERVQCEGMGEAVNAYRKMSFSAFAVSSLDYLLLVGLKPVKF